MNDEQRALILKMQKDLAPLLSEQAERLDAMCGLNADALNAAQPWNTSEGCLWPDSKPA